MEKVIMYRNKGERVAVMKKLDKMGYVWNSGTPLKEFDPTDYDRTGGGLSLNETKKTVMYGTMSSFEKGIEEYELIPARNFLNDKIKPIVICRKGRMVIAEDKTTGDKGVAVCSPDDEFDFYTGAAIALARLIDDCAISDDVKAEWKKRFGEEPSDDTDDFKVGDRVEIKTWKEMESQYHTDANGNIVGKDNFFVKGMSHLCGKTATINAINGTTVYLDFDENCNGRPWTFVTWMLKKTNKPKATEIRVGDRVKITNNGKSFAAYVSWIKDNVSDIEDAIRFAFKKLPEVGTKGTVIAKAEHSYRDDMLYYIKSDSETCYLMGEDGIEKV